MVRGSTYHAIATNEPSHPYVGSAGTGTAAFYLLRALMSSVGLSSFGLCIIAALVVAATSIAPVGDLKLVAAGVASSLFAFTFIVGAFCLFEAKGPCAHFSRMAELRAEQRKQRQQSMASPSASQVPSPSNANAGSRSGDSTMTTFNLALDEAYEAARLQANAKRHW